MEIIIFFLCMWITSIWFYFSRKNLLRFIMALDIILLCLGICFLFATLHLDDLIGLIMFFLIWSISALDVVIGFAIYLNYINNRYLDD